MREKVLPTSQHRGAEISGVDIGELVSGRVPQQLGINVSPSFQLRADEVIK
jgi:hypothetical protein